jgi:hypothetical protein
MENNDPQNNEHMPSESLLIPVFPDVVDESAGASTRVAELVEAVFTSEQLGEPIYRAAAQSQDPALKVDVAYALGVVGATAPFGRNMLETLVSDPDSRVREVASYCLASLDISV